MIPEHDSEEKLPFHLGFALVITICAVFAQFALLLTLATAAGASSPAHMGIATLVGYGAMFALAVPRIPDAPGVSMGFVPAPSRAWLATVLLVPSILLVSEVDNIFRAFYPMPEELRTKEQPAGIALVEFAIVYATVVPVTTELFFRGMIQPRLVEQLGRTRGVLVTAALSGLSWAALGGPWGLVVRTTEGLVFGVLREASGSLVPCLVLHVVFGLCSTLAAMQLFGIAGFDDLSEPHTPLAWLLPAALFTGVSLRLCQALLAGRSS